ncbi:MAG: COR domain-containing protein, partial [Spirulina sp.]
GNLTQLQRLYLDNNQLGTLPEFLGNLTQLQTLYLDNNQLGTLPEFLGNLTQLRSLYLDNNPLNPELAAAYEKGTEEVKKYLRAKAEGKIVLNEAKLILVGEGAVGKSCLLRALRGDPWVDGLSTTHGIEIKPVKVTNPDTQTEITLNAWDFGGQRVYRPTHQLFFSPSAIYLVVWKPREGPQQGFVKEWIALIKRRAPDAKILVIATHGGPSQRQPDIDRQELIDCFGEDTVLDFFFVDSKPDRATQCKGIDQLKQKIAAVAATLPGMGRTIPAKWYRVLQALKATDAPYLPYNDVLAICAEQGVEGFLAELCLRVYHTLGEIVHYHYDRLLKDIVILKPDWLAKAISFVLDDPETRKNNGLVERDRLSEIWENPPYEGETGYPQDLHPIFLRLMERFDISYRVVLDAKSQEESTTSLIAQLVPDNRPDRLPWSPEPEAGENQQVQICRIVDDRGQFANAEGLFYQLIVRLHKYSLGRDDYNQSVHWQRGLILDDDYNGRAFLEHIGTNIRITVRAAYPERFLYELTKEVKWLVESFWEGLRCEIVVPCIDPCGKDRIGLGLFEVQKLIQSKLKGRTDYPCSVSGCDTWHDIDALMRNAPTPTPQPLQSEQILGKLKQIRQDIRIVDRRNQVQFQNLDRGQQVILSQVDRQFSYLMQAFVDEAKDGPRLFSFQPVEPGFFDRPQWISAKFKLTLWCEHSRQPLPALNPDNETAGVYTLELSREWFAKTAPYLKFMTTTLGLIAPVASSASKILLDDRAYENIASELKFAQQTIVSSTKGGDIAIEWLGKTDVSDRADLQHGESIRAQGALLRQLHAIIKERDPGFGGLVKVQNKRREFLWVHPQFVGEY